MEKNEEQQNHAASQYDLSLCNHNDVSIEKNEERAVALWKKEANQGYSSSQCNLGTCYHNGKEVVERSGEEAVRPCHCTIQTGTVL